MPSSTEIKLVRAQAIGGVLFTVFLVLHISNTLLAPLGPEIYNDYQRTIRQFYQQPVFEIIFVLGPLVAHVIAGIWLYVLRKKWRRTIALPYRIQSWAGLFLLLVVFGHVIATRGVSFWFGTFPEFEGISFSLWWVPSYFYPYYFLLFMAGLYHGTMGLTVLLKRSRYRRLTTSKGLPLLLSTMGAVGVSSRRHSTRCLSSMARYGQQNVSKERRSFSGHRNNSPFARLSKVG
jgi:succinate dehydrogenase/fumarate reductase cytochrome b subunit